MKVSSTIIPIDYSEDKHLSPAVKTFLHPLNAGGPPLESLSVEEARNVLVGAQASFEVDLSGIEETEKTIEQNGFKVDLNIVRPKDNDQILPIFLFIHGGGWVLGDYPTHKRMVRDLVVLTGFAGVFVNYSRAPEARYPQPVHEIYAVLTWISQNGADIGVDGSNVSIVGNSAGGNLSAATALMAKASGGPHLKVQVLFWPVTDATFDNESYQLYGTQRFLTSSLMQWMWDQYIDQGERNEIYASPLRATLDELRGLPPTLIQVAENDILRDEGEAYGRKLSEAGVDVTTVRYNDVIHDFGLLNGLAEIPQTKALFMQAAQHLLKYQS